MHIVRIRRSICCVRVAGATYGSCLKGLDVVERAAPVAPSAGQAQRFGDGA